MSTQSAGIQPLGNIPDGLSLRRAKRVITEGGINFHAGPIDEVTGTVMVYYIDAEGNERKETCRVFRAPNGALVINLCMGNCQKRRTVFLQ